MKYSASSVSEAHDTSPAQIRQLYAQSREGMIAGYWAAVVFVFVFRYVVPHNHLIIWFISFSVVQVIRYALMSAFHRISPGDASISKWGKWFTLITVLSFLQWGMAGVFLFPGDSYSYQAIFAVFFAGISCVGAVVLSPVTSTYLPALLCTLAPASARFIYEGSEISVVLGTAIGLFGIIMFITAKRMHGMMIRNLRLGLEKNDLIDVLSEQKRQTESFNEELRGEIAERKRAEEALRHSEERYKAVVNDQTELISRFLPDGTLTFVNEACCRFMNKEPDQLIGHSLLQYVVSEDVARLQQAISTLTQSSPIVALEHRVIKSDGEIRWVQWSDRAIYGANGRLVEFQVVGRDITERKTAEEALEQSEEKFRSLVQTMNDGFIIIDENGVIAYVNDKLAEIWSYPNSHIIGRHCCDFLEGPAKELLESQLEIGRQGLPNVFEIPLVSGIGRRVELGVSAKPILDVDGKYGGSFAVVTDITRQKNAEAQLVASLNEKELLLREIHHRVKNNLQVVSSLLRLQSRYPSDDKYREMLDQSQNRIQSMALIHEKLYQSEELGNINFEDYVKALASHLFQGFGAGCQRIKLITEIAAVSLTIDKAIPCGLLANELLSNCLKHAFPHGKGGIIKMSFVSEDHRFKFVVSDDGVGLPGDFDVTNTPTMGLRLVNTLVNQLKGELRFKSEDGAWFQIIFGGTDQKTGPPQTRPSAGALF